MGQALYRKYRSRSLDEVVGQTPITSTLQNALKQGKISHAYLFTGPRGVGKTSVARIMAHEINGLPYDGDDTHLDIIEIDAASNRRIDEIRDLRDKVHISPTSAKYKVYIIDEVHMLTKEAFNALLKTLEEPPAHVVFILATTEVHKLPETIISRTQRFSFQPATIENTKEHLRSIAAQEKIKVSDDALELIAMHGEGSFRDSVSLLDQAHSMSDEVTLESVQQLLGIAPEQAIEQLLRIVARGTPQELINHLAKIREEGLQSVSIAKQLSSALRSSLMAETAPLLNSEDCLFLLEQLLGVSGSLQPDRQLEIALLKLIIRRTPAEKPATAQSEPAPAKKNTEVASVPKPKKKPAKNSDFSTDNWADILADVKTQYSTLHGILRLSRPEWDGDTLTLLFDFPFHQKRMNETRNKERLTEIIQKRTGNKVEIIAVLATNGSPKAESVSKPQDIQAISSIFGSAEVLD